MRETPEELAQLQFLLDGALSRSTAHLRSIVTGRSMTADQLTRSWTACARSRCRP